MKFFGPFGTVPQTEDDAYDEARQKEVDAQMSESLIERLENSYQFECEGGPLRGCVEWIALKAELDHLSAGLATCEARAYEKAAKVCGDKGRACNEAATRATKAANGAATHAADRHTAEALIWFKAENTIRALSHAPVDTVPSNAIAQGETMEDMAIRIGVRDAVRRENKADPSK